MKKKAYISVITGLFLVIVIVFGLIAFFGLYGIVVQSGQASRQSAQEHRQAKELKDALLLCHEQTFLTVEKLAEENSVCDLPFLPAYKVEQKAVLGCESNQWVKGQEDPNADRIIYKVAVRQTDGAMCLADLIIYEKKETE